jgi:hypothetical protein
LRCEAAKKGRGEQAQRSSPSFDDIRNSPRKSLQNSNVKAGTHLKWKLEVIPNRGRDDMDEARLDEAKHTRPSTWRDSTPYSKMSASTSSSRGFIKLEDTIAVTEEGRVGFGDQGRGWNRAG